VGSVDLISSMNSVRVAQSSFDAQMRAALPTLKKPALGASERIEQAVATTSAATYEPYNAGHDLMSGIAAAGGALLAALIVVLLLVLVASSRHHEH